MCPNFSFITPEAEGTMRTSLIIALVLGIVACQNLPAEKTGTSLRIGLEFATPTDKLPESAFGLVILNPALENPESVDTRRNRAFCEQYLRTPPPGDSTSPNSNVRPIHTLWMVTGGPDPPSDCPQMLERYDLARSVYITRTVHFLAGGPNGQGPYLALIDGKEAVLVDGSSFTDFSALLKNWNAAIAATQPKLAESSTGTNAGDVVKTILTIFLILFIMGLGPAGA
jgi:hypothetical protein